MARGYPDFFGYSVFPWHGAVTEESGSEVVGIGATTTILTLAGKRVVYSVDVRADGLLAINADIVTLYTDTVLLSAPTWEVLRQYDSSLVGVTEFSLLFFDEDAFVGVARASGMFSVGTSIHLTYENNSGAAVTVSCNMSTAIIT